MVCVERVNQNSKRQIYQKQENGLPDDGAGLRLWFGTQGRLRFDVSHEGHGRSCLAPLQATWFLHAGVRGSESGCRGRLWVLGPRDCAGGRGDLIVFEDGLEERPWLGSEKRLIFHLGKQKSFCLPRSVRGGRREDCSFSSQAQSKKQIKEVFFFFC